MTTTANPDPIRAAMDRLLAETRAIDPQRALEGIKANRAITRSHRHSVRHRAYR